MVVKEFATTMGTADDLNSAEDLRKVLTIILLYGVMWTVGLSLLFVMMLKNQSHKTASETKSQSSLEAKKKAARASRSKEDIRQYLVAYGKVEYFQSHLTCCVSE